MIRLGLYCKTCHTIFYRFGIPFSISKLYEKKKEKRIHLHHHVDIVKLDS